MTHNLLKSSGETEWYTPVEIIEAARAVMGRIALDPASSAGANEIVKADAWFGLGDNSLERAWMGPLWMNHPFGKAETACLPNEDEICPRRLRNPAHKCHLIDYHGNAAWINKLIYEYEPNTHGPGNVSEAICITYACTSEGWFQPLLRYPQVFLCPRTNYRMPDGKIKAGVQKGSAITYLGRNGGKFAEEFKRFGIVKIPYTG